MIGWSATLSAMMTLGLLALTLSPRLEDDQASLAILVETKLMRVAGMPAMPALPPGIKLPEGVALPGTPTRSLNVQLWAPKTAPQDAFAYLTPPSGLKLGNRLDLELTRPGAGTAAAGGFGIPGSERTDFTIKIYWGSSEKVQPGQPKVIHYGGLSDEQKAEMRRMSHRTGTGAAASWTEGSWPTGKQKGAIKGGAALPGSYALTTNFTGNVTLDVPSDLDFLPAIKLSSPALDDKPDLSNALPLEWSPLPTALGGFASAFGMEDSHTMVIWVSSKEYKQGFMMDPGFLQMAEVRDLVKDGTFMAPDQTTVTVPAGIFKDAKMAMLNMIAYGPGTALAKGQPLPRLQTKSTLSVMLGGKDSE